MFHVLGIQITIWIYIFKANRIQITIWMYNLDNLNSEYGFGAKGIIHNLYLSTGNNLKLDHNPDSGSEYIDVI